MNTDDEAGGRGEVKTTKRISIHEKESSILEHHMTCNLNILH
jgi:hypothetical protein